MPVQRNDEAGAPVDAGAPVFVDASGRRLRRARLIGGVILAVILLYMVLVVSAFFEGPRIGVPLLPFVSHASKSIDKGHSASTPPDPLTASPPEAQIPATPVQRTVPISQATAAVPAAAATPAPAPSTSSATPSPTATTPGKSATAPGQTRKPPHP